jgi:hypothetical protein
LYCRGDFERRSIRESIGPKLHTRVWVVRPLVPSVPPESEYPSRLHPHDHVDVSTELGSGWTGSIQCMSDLNADRTSKKGQTLRYKMRTCPSSSDSCLPTKPWSMVLKGVLPNPATKLPVGQTDCPLRNQLDSPLLKLLRRWLKGFEGKAV